MSQHNHKKKQGVIKPDKTVELTSFEGIMPDPETLEALEKLYPGATGKWMELAEKEILSRQKNEDRITWTFKYSTILGQVLGFLSSGMIFLVGCYALKLGFDKAAYIIITGSAASVIAAFIFRRRNNS